MKVERMLKLHWKKILLSIYVIAVLIVSASVRADVLASQPDKGAPDLKSQLRQLSSEIAFMKDRGLLSTSSIVPSSKEVKAEPQSMYGQFVFKNSFDGSKRVYFVAQPSNEYFEVNLDSIYNADISTDSLYQVAGFIVKPTSRLKPQLTSSFIVTSVKLQR